MRYVQQNFPGPPGAAGAAAAGAGAAAAGAASAGVHLVFQDLDVLPLSSLWLAQVFGRTARPFTVAGRSLTPLSLYHSQKQ